MIYGLIVAIVFGIIYSLATYMIKYINLNFFPR